MLMEPDMIKFKKNQVLTVPVIDRRRENNKSYYICSLEDGTTCEVGMFPFQKKEPLPEDIEIFVKDVMDGRPVVTQNTASLFRRFYEEGGIYTFLVEDFIPAYPKAYYRITDRNGLTVKLSSFGDREDLKRGQYVSCRISRLSSSIIETELVEEAVEQHVITFRYLSSSGPEPGWLEHINEELPEEERIPWMQRCFARWALRQAQAGYMHALPALETCTNGGGEWIIELIASLDEHMNEWMGQLLRLHEESAQYSSSTFYLDLLKCFRRICIYLLEDSDEISLIEDENIRVGYQEILSRAEHHARDFETAVSLLVADKEDAAVNYAESVLHKIERSGYLLSPEKRLLSLTALFHLRPELMDRVFPQFMWSVIGSRKVWDKEPFHTLVFGLLERYIEYSAGIIDTRGYDETDTDNNRLHLTIRALALQLLLASPSDDIDVRYYRAMLYRLCSYVPGAESEVLLEKSFRCLTGTGWPSLEFGWTVIQMLNPSALAGMLGTAPEGVCEGYRVYHGRMARFYVKDGAMGIASYESSLRQRKQLAADMMTWHNVQILSGGKPDSVTKPVAGEDDLERCQAWWSYLEKCLFLYKVQPTPSRKGDGEESLPDSDELMSRRSLIELARVIDRYAILRDNLRDTYHYLSFATMLVRLAEDRWLQDNYEARRRLLVSLYRFSNRESASVESTLREFEGIDLLVNTDRQTRKLVQEVRIVTCLGNPALSQALWKILQESADEEVQRLCRLALSYNLLEGISLDNGQREELVERINEQLGIRISVPKAVVIGYESSTLEFKTSIVYPPSRTGSKRPALAEQTLEILRQVCGFLNAEGGTLMLGVNDFGRISGLEGDLEYKEFEGSRDRYCRYIRDNIREELGDMAESLVTETILDMGGHFILALRVRPSEQPVLLRDNLWQRSGAETLNRIGEVKASFLHSRPMVYAQIDGSRKYGTDWRQDIGQEQVPHKDNAGETSSMTIPEPPEPEKETLAKAFDRIVKPHIREYEVSTSLIRQKRLASGDYYPAFYLYFTDGEYYRTESNYDEGNSNVMLTLPVLTEDLEEEAWLTMVYEDATVIRVPLTEIAGRDEWRHYKRYDGARLFFAGIGGINDSLVTAFHGQAMAQYRCDDIVRLKEGGMQDVGDALVTCRFRDLCYCEIVSRLAISGMRPALYNPTKAILGSIIQATGYEAEKRTLARAGIKTDY